MTWEAAVSSPFRRWLRDSRPIPGGRATRVLIAIAALVWAGIEVASGRVDPASAHGLLALALAFLPIAALSAGIVVSLAAWVIGLAGFLLLGSPGDALLVMMLPGVILVAAASWLLPWKSGITVSIVMCGALLGLYLRADVEHDSILIGVLVVLIVAVVLYRPYALYRRRYEQSAAQVRDLHAEQEQVRREERTRLAHELHDIVAHEVTVIAMQARRNEIVGDLSEKASEINRGIADAAQQTLRDLRRLVLLLKEEADEDAAADPAAPDEAGIGGLSGETTDAVALTHDLGEVVQSIRRAGFTVDLDVTGDVARVPLSLRQALRRTVREIGTNVLKHADRSEPVEMALRVIADQVVLTASNTPAGVRALVSSHTGLEAIRERCEVFCGTVTAGASGGRWTTTVTLPLPVVTESSSAGNTEMAS